MNLFPEKQNTMFDLLNFFGKPREPMLIEEFWVFWESLSEKEKEYYRTAELDD